MTNTHLAFMIGLLGSIHCIGMCGPLAFAVPVLKPGWRYLLWDKLSYQAGRIISYCILGVVIGILGKQIWLAGLQNGVSIMSGLLILLAAASRLFNFSIRTNNSVLLKPFYKLFNYALKHKANHLIIGMLNGLLPCGFVYLALAGAVNTGSITEAVEYMFWFGTGTVPLMLIAGISAGFTGLAFRRKINKMLPWLMICLGIWFIFRGLQLDIPYLSPAKSGTITECR
ncbi:sulfite exporter TauE/SafE family protein [Pedobacter sp. MC2016-14]|uniref:sulfite exporter TauE/SafE family protein n=1 Tax=Pedobacter sp. MC2016-14 TaxID=2897327 RepID=UPI001E3A7A67|nr:sulfite exporter TauE/SafE family protein [Pedobacter sp. MC2016-14]MCD0489244.1 sulfite exporter TauE/SafE family protein [Pedobacter sp. MC2016-14]